ncbi:MAG: NAD(P)H-hydrate dehydratase [Bdellovibrionales bacterium]|nr:NAD(P)H-hydrate dehydratase [Bdellovibrionales bacterium]
MYQLRICTNEEMRRLDKTAETEMGIGPVLLMENAGRAASEIIVREYPGAGIEDEIIVFAGKGNNAGDAFVVARQLLGLGRKVRVFHLVPGNEYKGATAENFKILQRMKAKLAHITEAQELEAFLGQARPPVLAIDGIIGTGLKGDLEGHFYDVVELINQNFEEIVSLDIPTGVSGDSGQVQGTAIQATLTISFGFPRLGHFLPPGANYRGKLVNVDISLPHRFSIEGNKFLLQAKTVARKIVRRDRYAHKNTFGHVLMIGGSAGRTGAISMATRAALRTGTGLATVASWSESMGSLMAQLPEEAMTLTIPEHEKNYDRYADQLKQFSAVVVGPGMGNRPEAKRLIEILLGYYQGPIVLDADALNILSEHQLHSLCQNRKAPTVLTPHPGEMARLLGCKKDDVIRDPLGSLKKAVDLTHSVVLLKGAATLLFSPDEVMYLNHFPNSGMATAGSGDVLAGMIGALLAQGLSGFDAAQVGVYLHSLAGARAARKVSPRGMMAGDIIRCIPGAYLELQKVYGEEEEPRMAKLL